MANRRFDQFVSSLSHKVVCLDGYVQLDATGAVVAQSLLGATVSKSGTGLYTIALQDSYPAFLTAGVHLISQTGQALTAQIVDVGLGAVQATKNINQIRVRIQNSSAVPTDVTSPAGLSISLRLKNSGV